MMKRVVAAHRGVVDADVVVREAPDRVALPLMLYSASSCPSRLSTSLAMGILDSGVS